MGCDTICDLPDSLLTQILLYLPTKDSVKTSVLSTRWRNLWLSVPGLDLATNHFPCEKVFARFMDRFVEFNHHRSRLQKFELSYENFDGYRDRFMELIGTVVDPGIQHLDVTMYPCKRDVFMHQNIYKSKTLVSLKLNNVELKNPEFVVSLPCLKIMKLFNVCYGKDGPLIVEKLILGCPVLEDLELIRPFDILNEKVVLFVRVSSQTLERCCLGFGGNPDFTVEIDAPRLNYMSLTRIPSDKIVVKNLSSLFMIRFDLRCGSLLQPKDLRMRDIFCDILARVSSVRHMTICEWTLEVLSCYSKLAPIPKFHNLYHLRAEYCSYSFQLSLLPFLESCPNLKILSIVNVCFVGELNQIDFTNVPRCLISTLEYVEIIQLRGTIVKYGIGNIKLGNYFLENSAVLKKLTLSFKDPLITKQELESYKKLLTSTKLSPTCQVIID